MEIDEARKILLSFRSFIKDSKLDEALIVAINYSKPINLNSLSEKSSGIKYEEISNAAKEYSKNVWGPQEFESIYPDADMTKGETTETDFKYGIEWYKKKLNIK